MPVWLPQTSPWLYNQVRLLRGIDNHIVCERIDNWDQYGIENVHVGAKDGLRYIFDRLVRKAHIRRYASHLIPIANRVNADIIHSHWGDVAWANLKAVKKLRIKHVATFYGKEVNYLPTVDGRWRDRYRELFSEVDLVLCEGPHMASVIEKLGCKESKIRVHHLGVDLRDISFRPRRWSRAETLRILIAASFREKKGIPFAIEAIGRLKVDVPNIEITVIGDASNDPRSHPEKIKILNAVHEHGLNKNTRFLGYQPYKNLFDEAYKHHIFISPSVTASDGDTEGGAPVTLIDLAATGMPIISTTHCDIPNVILHGQTGLLAEERDATGLYIQLRWLAEHPREWDALTLAARKRMELEFNAVRQAERLKDVYRSVL